MSKVREFCNVLVAGAGPSGLMAAIFAAKGGASVIVIEKNNKPLRKLYATGNGRCNFSNLNMDGDVYRGGNAEYARAIIEEFDRDALLDFFHECGMMTKDIDGYFYPYNEQARTVADALLFECRKYGVEIRCGETVCDISFEKNESLRTFCVETDSATYDCARLVIAVGGKASPAHGSDGNLNDAVKLFGHTIRKQRPALVPLEFGNREFRQLQGVRVKCAVSLTCGDGVLSAERGEIIFNKDNISGIPVMQMSRFATCARDKKNHLKLHIDLFPDEDFDGTFKLLSTAFRGEKRESAEALSLCINEKLAVLCLKRAGIDPEGDASEVSEKRLRLLAETVKDLFTEITGDAGFERAQVTAGGVPLDELNEDMSSKLCPGLYIVGELCDVDGTCGGYNLQWAFSTGAIAGKSASRKKGGLRYAERI